MQSVAAGAQVPGCGNRLFENAELALRNWDIPLLPSESATSPLAPAALLGAVAARQPVGVVGCITPYNFPLTNTAGKIGPALAMGNTVIIKPAPQDPLGSIELVRVLDEVGFPPGVVNLLTGSSPEVGAALVDSPDVDMISFTGSSVVGAKIFEAGGKTMKRLLMELGGKGAALVLADADVPVAVRNIMSVWAFHSGQICTAPTRVIAHRSVYQELVDGLAAAAGMLITGDPLDPSTVVGPVISEAHRDRVESMIASGESDGAEVVVDGRRPEHLERGLSSPPRSWPNAGTTCTWSERRSSVRSSWWCHSMTRKRGSPSPTTPRTGSTTTCSRPIRPVRTRWRAVSGPATSASTRRGGTRTRPSAGSR